MERRQFMHRGLAAGAGVLASGAVQARDQRHPAAGTPFRLNYGIHDGLFKNLAGPSFIDQLKFAYDQGFRAMEDNGMMKRPPEEQARIGETMQKLGMQMGVFVNVFDDWPVSTSLCSGDAAWRKKFIDYSHKAVETSKRCGGKLVTVVPGNYDRNISPDYQTAHVIAALREAAPIYEAAGMIMVLEPLSDTPDLFLRHSAQTYAVCKAVNSPACKILFDMYHMQRNEGDIMNNIDRAWDEIGYFQIGDNPGRREPGTGEMNYKNIFRHIYDKGYRGVLGMEHGKEFDTAAGETLLIKRYREADSDS